MSQEKFQAKTYYFPTPDANFVPMASSYDPLGSEAVYAKAVRQEIFLDYLDYDPILQPVEWDQIVCVDDQYRVHFGPWPHAFELPEGLKEKGNSLIFQSNKKDWIDFCNERVFVDPIPKYLLEHKQMKIIEQ